MGERKKRKTNNAVFSLTDGGKNLDPTLTSLFSVSSGPIQKPPPRSIPQALPTKASTGPGEDDSAGELSPAKESDTRSQPPHHSSPAIDQEALQNSSRRAAESRKRHKRKREDDNLEALHLQKLTEESSERPATQKPSIEKPRSDVSQSDLEHLLNTDEKEWQDEPSEDGVEGSSTLSPPPQHETLAPSKTDSDLENASRTVFLSNVSNLAITSKSCKKALLHHMGSICKTLPVDPVPARVESLRFRSTAYSGGSQRRAAFAKKDLMEATTKSTNAYVVYSTKAAAREAARTLNGTVVLDRHLRVDGVAHPAKKDNRRCVFVGNLSFVDDETQIKATQEIETGRKQSKPKTSDSEEGLWRQFGKAGTVESVRVVRDPSTRVGKGFAYVQFMNENAVEAALLFNEKSFPPLLPRKLRVVRAKKFKRKPSDTRLHLNRKNAGSTTASDPSKQSMQGRIRKLLGRSADAAAKRPSGRRRFGTRNTKDFIFEGHRASSGRDKAALNLRNNRKKKPERPKNRGAKRAAAWKTKQKAS